MYIHERPDWPLFYWHGEQLTGLLAEVRHRQGRLLGRMDFLGFDLQREVGLDALTDDIVKTSEIEGQLLASAQVRSSVAQRLGLDAGGLPGVDRNALGVVDLMVDATRNCGEPLTASRLFDWQSGLFPFGHNEAGPVVTGAWRDDRTGPMQVVSGPLGRQRVHFQAPPADRIETEMAAFLDWYNGPLEIDPVLQSGLAHFWFVTIHPFEDGNGRIARAIADMALARYEGGRERFYSMPAQISRDRGNYYQVLESAQKGAVDISGWMVWFVTCLGRAIESADAAVNGLMERGRFWGRFREVPFNERQRKVVTRLLEGFEGTMTTSRWARLAGCSRDTALKDVSKLVDRGVLRRNPGGGRSTSYRLNSAE